jgi:hypothetical protein
MGSPAEHVLRLAPAPQPAFQDCPRWCLDHFDHQGQRTHAGPEQTIMGRSSATGRRTDIRFRVEVRDDGHGQADEVFVLDVAGTQIDLSPGRMHDFLKAGERVFWKTDTYGAVIVNERRTRTETASEPSTEPAIRGVQNRGGRA